MRESSWEGGEEKEKGETSDAKNNIIGASREKKKKNPTK